MKENKRVSEPFSSGLQDELNKLVKASETGNFGVVLNDSGLSSDESKTIRLLNKAVDNYQTAMEYDLMKYRLTSDALNIALWDMAVVDGNPINPNNKFVWSQEFRHMLGFSDENDFPNLLHSWSDLLHPEDKERTLNAFAKHIKDHTGKTPYNIEYRLMLKNGTYRDFHAFGTTLRSGDGVPLRVAGALQDITDKKLMTETLQHREKLLNTLNEMDLKLLSNKYNSFDAVLSDSLKPLANTANLDWIIVYRFLDDGIEQKFGQIYRWSRELGDFDHNIEALRVIPNLPAIKNWIKILSNGDIVNIHTSIMSEEEKAFLNTFGIKSLLLAPFIVNNELWGAVAFQDHTNERCFEDDCIGFLSSAARLCANAIIKNDKTQSAANAMEALKRREKMTSVLNNASIIFLSQAKSTFMETMTAGVRLIVDMLEVDRISLWRNFSMPDGLHTSQIYRWDRDSGGTTVPTHGLDDLAYHKVAPRWEELLALGESINSPVHLLPESALLKSFGIVSAFITPVFIGNTFWGFALFEDRRKERYFDEESTEMMRSAAFLCVNSVVINEKNESLQKAIEALKRREKMISALNETAIMLLSGNNEKFEDVMSNSLKPVANAANIDRVAVYRLLDGKSTLGQIYLWYGKTLPLEDELVVLPDIPPTQRWLEKATKGECINDNVKNMPEDAAAFLKMFGVKSVFMVPIFSRDEFWGVITLEDHTNYRYFDEEYIDLLRSAAHLCAGAIVRTEMEREITAANEFTRRTLDAAPIGYSIIDADLNILDCNDTIVNIMETTKQNYIDNFYDLSPETQPDGSNSKDKSIEYMLRALDGEKLTVEWVHRSMSGELIPLEITLLRGMYNNKYILQAYQYDLRNMKKMEKTVAETVDLMSAITEASPISYVLFNESMQAVDCNKAIMQLLNCSDKHFFLENYWELFVPEVQPDGEGSLKQAIAMRNDAFIGRQTKFEWVHRSLSGELIPTENTLTCVTHKGNRMVISFKYDLRNTKKMTESIREQSELLKIRLEQQELLSEISRGFIASGDSETLLKEAIAKLGQYHKVPLVFIFGFDYERDEAYPAYYWSASGSPPRLVALEMLNLIKSNFPERLPDCATIPVLACDDVASSPIKAFHALLAANVAAFICAPLYVEGRLWGILSVEQYFTPRKWTENEKSFVAMTASTIAGVIMRNIYNTMLKEAFEKATTASKAKGEFLSNMSHEMRTPLNAIIGMTAIGKNAKELERKDYALNKIEDASAHLLGVINDVLDMSKIEANKLELSSIEFNFEKMLQRVVNIINFRVDEKTQKLTVHIDENIPEYLVGDDQRITQVITNLLGNAVKFTPEKGFINLDVRLLEEKKGLCTIQISVTDTGIGISVEQQQRLFQSFQQAEASTVRKYGGTGLGLAICKSIVEMMDGKIWVESEVDKGSAFFFTIKIKQGEGKKMTLQERVAKWDKIRILAVDDEPDVLEFFKEISQRYNLHCDTASCGDEALQLVEQNGDYNVFFIDFKLPDIDGITLTDALRALDRNSYHSIVILTSAVEWQGIEDKARKAGVDRFLSKPLFPSSVADTISECLGLEKYQKDAHTIKTDSLAGHCILLVEDVEINREIVLTLLEPTEIEIDCAENGLQAVEMFCKDPDRYEMIFMDVHMPEMDGYGATRLIRDFEIKQGKKRPGGVPIIAMTANVFKEDIERCLKAGMNDHIGKPLDIEIVKEKLYTYLK